MKHFNSFEAWSKYMNESARGKWYIAGGCAAWLHIENYPNKDIRYYQTVRNKISPGDIEISIHKDFAGRILESVRLHGGMSVSVAGKTIHVDIQTEGATFESALLRCTELHGAKIHSIPMLKISYSRAGAAQKAEKRELRLAMLKLISERKRIDKAGVDEKKSAPRLANQLFAAVQKRGHG